MHNTFWTTFWFSIINLFSWGMGALTRKLCDVAEHNHNFLFLKITFICSIIAFIIAILSDYYIANKHKDSVKMKFSYFRDTYYINPKAWALTGESASWCARENIDQLRYVKYEKYYGRTVYYIKFSFIDWLKFRWWMIQYKCDKAEKAAQKEKEKEAERLAEIIAAMQSDVNKAFKEIENGCKKSTDSEILPF